MQKEKIVPAHELLCAWLTNKRGSQSALASGLGVTRSAVSQWCAGERVPDRTHAQKIEWLSHREVPADKWPRINTTGAACGPQKIRVFLEKKMWTVSQGARACGVPFGTFRRIVEGTTEPKQKNIEKIETAFKLSFTANSFCVARNPRRKRVTK